MNLCWLSRKNVSRLGWKSSPSCLATIHWCEPSQWTWLTHQNRFIYSRHNKWPSRIAYSYDQHKQVSFHCQCSFFFHKCQMVSCWWLTFSFLASLLRWTTWSCHLFMISFTFNPSKRLLSTNSRRSFQMPNTKKCNNKIKKTCYSLMHEEIFEYMYKVNLLNLVSNELNFLEHLHLIIS